MSYMLCKDQQSSIPLLGLALLPAVRQTTFVIRQASIIPLMMSEVTGKAPQRSQSVRTHSTNDLVYMADGVTLDQKVTFTLCMLMMFPQSSMYCFRSLSCTGRKAIQDRK